MSRTAFALLFLIAISICPCLYAAGPASPDATSVPSTQPFKPGNQFRTITVDGRARSYFVHVPPKFDAKKPTPVVLNLHGAFASAPMQAIFSGMNAKADAAGFVVVYPNGTGIGEGALFWNSFAKPGPSANPPDDVKFIAKVLDEVQAAMTVDKSRVFATGMSNGAMMCYRLAAELSDRIAAIAPVSGTLTIDNPTPSRPVSVIHFHGTADKLVPFDGPKNKSQNFANFKSVDETIKTWIKLDGCPDKPVTTKLPDTAHDGTTATRNVYGPGKDGAEVVLYVIEGGGHTWPGRNPILKFLGNYTRNISANDLIWEFFEKHPMKAKP